MDTIVQYSIRAYGVVSTLRFDLHAAAVLVAEDVYGVDDPAVQIVKVTTTFEVVT